MKYIPIREALLTLNTLRMIKILWIGTFPGNLLDEL